MIAKARADMIRGAETWPCHLITRLADMQRDVRPAPSERGSLLRLSLSEIEAARLARARVLRGGGTVSVVTVVGRARNIRRVAADPRIRDVRFARVVSRGARQRFVFARPGSPPEALRPGTPRQQSPRRMPEIDALSDEEVQARLDRLTDDPPAECRKMLSNGHTSETVVRAQRVAGQPGVYRAARLLFHPRVDLVTQGGVAPQPANTELPQAVRLALTVTNLSLLRATRQVRGCTLMLRVYRADDPGREPVWDASRMGRCMEDPMRLSLWPGQSRTFEDRTDMWRILGTSLPPGRYAFAALFRLADETIEIPAGEVELPNRLEGLAYSATTQLVDSALRVSASITNTTSRPVYLEYGACTLGVRAYRAPDRSGEPVWRSEFRAPWAGYGQYVCLLYLATATVAPGATFQPREFQAAIPLIEILGDSLPDGRYYFSASLRLNFTGAGEFPAGSAEISVPRHPLPASRMAESVTYSAVTSVSDDLGVPLIRTAVTATLAQPGRAIGRGSSALMQFSRDCALVLHAYRDRARRDEAPRSGPADWMSARNCGPKLQEIAFVGGTPHTFEARAAAREILGDRLPPGRYYFAAEVRSVWLSAGEAELTGR